MLVAETDPAGKWETKMDERKQEAERNVETVLEGYEAFNRGDVDWVIDHLDPEVEWHDAPEVPGGAVHHGRDDVRVFLSSFPRFWEVLRFEPLRLLASGDTVLSLVEMTGRGRSSGAGADAEVAHLFRFRAAKCRSAVTFFDRDEALRAAGFSEDDAERAWARSGAGESD
jgi:ketosteroid isomerase-like protein